MTVPPLYVEVASVVWQYRSLRSRQRRHRLLQSQAGPHRRRRAISDQNSLQVGYKWPCRHRTEHHHQHTPNALLVMNFIFVIILVQFRKITFAAMSILLRRLLSVPTTTMIYLSRALKRPFTSYLADPQQ
ncbi:protein of unknown function [Rhodovastum atsumiense]|nr:protein of unknown function [Rhodovastum atsumiense]